MKMHTVISGLLYQRGAFAHLPSKVEGLRAHGVEVVVSLYGEDPDLPGVVEYRYQYMPDGKRLDVEAAEALGSYVADQIRVARPTLVHCHAGRNRSALITALAVRQVTGCSGREAIARVRSARPGSLANPVFVEYLTSLPAVTLATAPERK